MISVGGWTWSGKFSDAALTYESRTAFAESVAQFVVEHGFDGVDIDWEYPVGGGYPTNVARPQDKVNFTLLMAKLREKLDAQGDKDGKEYLLSFAGAAGVFYADNTELDKLYDYVDYAIIMTYDMHGPWPNTYTDFNAPLYTPSEPSPQYKWSCDDSVDLWISRGFMRSKIVMGLPFYGVKYNYVTDTNNGLLQKFVSGSTLTYDKIVSDYLSDSSYNRYVHEEGQVPWLFDGSTFISYDDAESIAGKTQYAKDSDLGGVAVWELSQNTDGTLIDVIYNNIK